MRHHSSVITAAIIASAFNAADASSALADRLIVEPSSPDLTPESFDYRFDATRRWLGCYSYDVLQGSGWYPAVWHHTAAFTPADGDFEVELRRSWSERYCAAELGINNYVQVVWTNPADPTQVHRGVLQVEANGTDKVDEVSCSLVDSSNPWNAIECERASVNVSGSGDAYIIIHFSGV